MRFTYTLNFGRFDYATFSWLTGEYDPNNMYALDDRGKKHEEYVENLEDHGIWFIKGWIDGVKGSDALLIDNYGNEWTQETVYSKERGLHLTRCPYKKRDYVQSKDQLPDQVIRKILNKEWDIKVVNTTRTILEKFEELKQDIEDERSGLKDFLQILGGSAEQKAEFRKNIALMNRGANTYELIPAITPPAKTVMQSVLGNRYIIGNPRHYIVIDNTGQVWSLGKSLMIQSSFDAPFIQYAGDTPTRHGEQHEYPLPTILQPFVSNILAHHPPHNKWGPVGDTVDPSVYNMSHLQPVAKYLFDTFAPETIKEAAAAYEEEAERLTALATVAAVAAEEKRRLEEEVAKAKEEEKRIAKAEEEIATAKRIAQEEKNKRIAAAQADLLAAQKRLAELQGE